MSDTETTDVAPSDEEAAPTDERREALLARITDALGDAVVDSHLKVNDDLWVRVAPEAWAATGEALRNTLGCRYFNFVSVIDWMISPFGRDMDSAVDKVLNPPEAGDAEAATGYETGYAGGESRFQVFARVNNIDENWAVTVKTDVPDSLMIDTWSGIYAGANWHEREAGEMYGLTFVGHPDPRKIYLPGDFQGFPCRKDYPLLARQVKPWPGIVDVEGMPGEGDEDAEEATS